MSKTPPSGIAGRPEGVKRPRGRPQTKINSSRAYPNVDKMRLQAQQYTDLALNTLVDVCNGTNAMGRVRAASELLDRGYGRTAIMLDERPQPATAIKITFADDKPKVIDAVVEQQVPRILPPVIPDAMEDETEYAAN